MPRSVMELLKLSRGQLEFFAAIQRRLLKGLCANPDLSERVARLQTIPGVGEIMALSWALEVGEVDRLASIAQAASYCGLTSAQHNSAGKEQRGPISRQRNKHLQTILIEAAKLAPCHNPQLAAVHERELQRGNRTRATLAVAQAGSVPDGGGQERQAIPDARERRGGGMSRWVDFHELKRSIGIEQVLASYHVELRRGGEISCAALVRCRRMVPGGVGRVLAWTPQRTCGPVIRPPAVKCGRVGWAATF